MSNPGETVTTIAPTVNPSIPNPERVEETRFTDLSKELLEKTATNGEPPIDDASLETFLEWKRSYFALEDAARTKLLEDGTVKSLVVGQKGYMEKLFVEERLLELAANSMPPAIQRTLLRHMEDDTPGKMEVEVPGSPRAFTTLVELKGISKLKEDNPDEYNGAIAKATGYLKNHGVGEVTDDKDVLEKVKLLTRDRFMERFTASDIGGIPAIRSTERITGAIGHPPNEDFNYTMGQIHNLLGEVNDSMEEIFGVKSEHPQENVKVLVSADVQKTVLIRLGEGKYIFDFEAKKGTMNPLVLVNNAAVKSGTDPEQLMIASQIKSGDMVPEGLKGEVVTNTKKGTKYFLQHVELAEHAGATKPPESSELSITERRYLAKFSIDNFIAPEKLIEILKEEEDKDLLENFLKDKRKEINLELGNVAYARVEMEDHIETTEGIIVKPDISGYSMLTAMLIEKFGIQSGEILQPFFERLGPMAEKCGALIDNFSGDAEDAVILDSAKLEKFGMIDNLYGYLANFDPAERSVIYGMSARLLFKTLQEEWKQKAESLGDSLIGVGIDAINEGNLNDVIDRVTSLYSRTIQTDDSQEHMDVVRGYVMAINGLINKKDLDLKAIAASDAEAILRITKVGNRQVTQSITSQKFLQQEGHLESIAKANDNRTTISVDTFTKLQDSSFIAAFEPMQDENGATIAYTMVETFEGDFKDWLMENLVGKE